MLGYPGDSYFSQSQFNLGETLINKFKRNFKNIQTYELQELIDPDQVYEVFNNNFEILYYIYFNFI